MRFGQGSVSTPSAALPPADSNQIQVEWWALPQGGTPFVLAELGDFDLADIAGSRGAISVSVPIGSATHDLLYANTVTANTDLLVEARLFGGANRALRGFLNECDGDDVAETGTRKWSGCLVAGLLYETRVAPNPADEKGEWHFAAKNAGQVIATLVQAAQARGELPGVTITTFNTSTDSLGNSWAGLASNVAIPPGKTLGEVLDDFLERGMSEWDFTGLRELRLYAPDKRGVDRTIGDNPVRLHRGRDLTDAPRKWSVRDAPTDILVAGKDGLYQTASDPSAQARRGRKIVAYASDGEVTDAGALQAYAQNKLATLSPGAVELSHGLVVNGVGPQPFIDVTVGDWVWSDTGQPTGPERLRVQQVSLSRSGDELKAVAVVGTLSMSAIVMLARRLARLESGTTIVGTSVDPSVNDGVDTTPPSAPTGLVAESIAYQDTVNGGTYARVDLSWQAVTTDADGSDSPRVNAAEAILARIQSEEPYFEDWTWVGKPDVVGVYSAELRAAYSGNTLDEAASVPWLQNYITVNTGTPTATDDVAGYRVRHAYVGPNQVGGIPSSDPFPDDLLPYVDDGTTTATNLEIGGVGAGVPLRLEVAAYDNDGNQSAWSLPLVIDTAVDNKPPPATSAPTIEPFFSGVRILWDGLSTDGIDMREAAADFKHVEVHLSQVDGFTPDITTYRDTLTTAGRIPIQGLAYGVGYFARLVAVDLADNPSPPSATAGPAVPTQLVNIDLGPDAVERLQIKDGEIVSAKIGIGQVNELHVTSVNAGAITTGIMTSDISVAGSIRTPDGRGIFDSAGLRLYNPLLVNTVNFDSTTGNALITGTYKSGPDGTGERVNILPDGTFRLYPAAGTNYSQIANFGNDVVWRGPMDPNGRSGRFNVNALGCGMNFSAESEIPSNLRAEIVVLDRQARMTSPIIKFQVNGKLSPADGSARRAMFCTTNSSGVDIGSSFVYYRMSSSGSGGFSGNGAGVKFEAGNVLVCGSDDLNSFGPIKASDFVNASSREVKSHIVPLGVELGMTAADVVRAVEPVAFSYLPGVADSELRHIGLVVEDVAPHAPALVVGWDGPAKDRSLSSMGVATVAWGAAAEAHREIARLVRRVAALEAQLVA